MRRFEDNVVIGIRAFLFALGVVLFTYTINKLPTAPEPLPLAPANNGQDISSPDHTGATVAILTNHKNVELYTRCWHTQESDRRGILVMIHGLYFHSEYFGEIAHILKKQGVSTCAIDLTGHGRSGSLRRIRGYTPSFEDWVSDADMFIRYLYQRNPGLPIFVYGESLGGAIALKLMRRPPLEPVVKGYIVSGTLVLVDPALLPPAWAMPVLKLVSYVLPRLGIPGHKVGEGWKDSFGDQEFAEMAIVDPLMVWETPKLQPMVSLLTETDDNWRHLGNITVPFLALHGKADTRTQPEYSQELYDRAASTDKALRLYDGMRHQLLQETERNKARVFADITEWLEQRLPAAGDGNGGEAEAEAAPAVTSE